MKILSVDTASTICSVAILEDTTVLYEKSEENGLTHSERLLPMIEEAFKTTNLSLSSIDVYSCNIGPGSFTGIRIGISTIKAFRDVFKKPCIGISSLEGLSYQTDSPNLICSLIDAKNSNVYYGIFQDHEKKEELRFLSLQELLDHLTNYQESLITFIGDASILYQKALVKLCPKANFTTKQQGKLSATSIARATYFHYQKGEVDSTISPLYLRKSQAERMLDKEK